MDTITQEQQGSAAPVERWRGVFVFFRTFLRAPDLVGAALPSSRRLAHALMTPFRARTSPASVLEVGAGTGAVTRHIGREMGPHDQLTICEMHPALAAHIRLEVLTHPTLAAAVAEQRVRLLVRPVQHVDPSESYDYIICGLPFTAFKPGDIEAVLDVVRTILRPGGVFSYFEYMALRRFRTVTSQGQARERMGKVSAILDDHIRRFEIGRRTVLANIPPAYARFWRFD